RPVLIHVADPAAFFTPLDRFNERWHELNANPGWLFYGGDNPKPQDLLDQLDRVLTRHPPTPFSSTHFGNHAEDLAAVAAALVRPPEVLEEFYRPNAERVLMAATADAPEKPPARELRVKKTDDFEVTGDGSAAAWAKAAWEPLHKRTAAGLPYETRIKALYSN